jgi:hypothetical protein
LKNNVKEYHANKEKYLGKQHSIESSLNNARKKGVRRGVDHPI